MKNKEELIAFANTQFFIPEGSKLNFKLLDEVRLMVGGNIPFTFHDWFGQVVHALKEASVHIELLENQRVDLVKLREEISTLKEKAQDVFESDAWIKIYCALEQCPTTVRGEHNAYLERSDTAFKYWKAKFIK